MTHRPADLRPAGSSGRDPSSSSPPGAIAAPPRTAAPRRRLPVASRTQPTMDGPKKPPRWPSERLPSERRSRAREARCSADCSLRMGWPREVRRALRSVSVVAIMAQSYGVGAGTLGARRRQPGRRSSIISWGSPLLLARHGATASIPVEAAFYALRVVRVIGLSLVRRAFPTALPQTSRPPPRSQRGEPSALRRRRLTRGR